MRDLEKSKGMENKENHTNTSKACSNYVSDKTCETMK
jgi:hypothetical protein